jgi:Ger(x)C family germination protein
MGFDCAGDDFTATISTGIGLENQPALLISRKGKTIPACLEEIENYSSKHDLYFNHTRYLILGENAARSGMAAYFDYVERNSVPRLDNAIFIVKGGSAKELITGSGEKDYDISEHLAIIERDTEDRGESFPFNNREVLRSTYEFGAALICAVEIQNLSGSVASENADITAVPAGFAIIRGDTLVGYIELEDCILGANILLNKTGSGTVTIPDGSGGTASLVLHEVKTAYSGQWQNGELIKITVTVDVSAELTAFSDYVGLIDPDTLVLLEENLENEIRSRCESILQQSRELKCDFLGLAMPLRHDSPGEFSKLSDDFSESLAQCDIAVDVSAKLIYTFVHETESVKKAG